MAECYHGYYWNSHVYAPKGFHAYVLTCFLFVVTLLSAIAHLHYPSDAFEMLQQKKVAANEEDLDIWSSIWGYGLLMASLGLDGMTGPAQERLYEVM